MECQHQDVALGAPMVNVVKDCNCSGKVIMLLEFIGFPSWAFVPQELQ